MIVLLMIIYLNWSNSNTELVPVNGWLDKIHRLDKTLGQELVPFPCLINITARIFLWCSASSFHPEKTCKNKPC